jgi:hypothetical protein
MQNGKKNMKRRWWLSKISVNVVLSNKNSNGEEK